VLHVIPSHNPDATLGLAKGVAMSRFASLEIRRLVEDYRAAHADLLDADAEFRRWFDEEYIPIGGGWQY
jgi:hypothetical protein